MFLMHGHDNTGLEIITVKCEPEYGMHLRDKYPDITPGYYMNKLHWNSVNADGKVPDEILKKMIDMSYSLILESLPKKIRENLD